MWVPSSIFTLHSQIARDIVLSHGQHCSLVYLKKEPCECAASEPNTSPQNAWVTGSRMPGHSLCSNCNYTGYREVEVTKAIRMMVYSSYKDWIKVNGAETLQAVAGIIQTRCMSENFPDIRNANYMTVNTAAGHNAFRYELTGDPVLHGMQSANELICFWKRM